VAEAGAITALPMLGYTRCYRAIDPPSTAHETRVKTRTDTRPWMKQKKGGPKTCDPCIYCASRTPPTKREHVMSQALGKFEQNWTLDCVCDDCNKYFADNLELALAEIVERRSTDSS